MADLITQLLTGYQSSLEFFHGSLFHIDTL